MTRTRYETRHGPTGTIAVHVRVDGPDGKRLWWEVGGRFGLGGLALRDLEPWATERVARLDPSEPVIVTEGERAAAALWAVGLPAVGTFGAEVVPSTVALARVAAGRRFLAWPDADEAGRRHMVAVADTLYQAGARAVYLLDYRPTAVPPWPKGHDAADFVASFRGSPEVARTAVVMLAGEWMERLARPVGGTDRRASPDRHPDRNDGSVTAALAARYGLAARPGRSVRCPVHDDRHASLSILRDDRRAICHAPTCAWASPGVTARDIAA